jgi:predicted nucleic acid-binding Zn ribbon protein
MTPTRSTLPAATDEPLHGCVRCGARIPVSQAMCERCNPLGLKEPAASQAHGTVFVGIGIAVVVMAVVARLAVTGVGPFSGGIAKVAADPAGLLVTIAVTNEGSSAGSTTCRVGDPQIRGVGPETAFVTSPVVPPGQTVTFSAVVASLGTTVKPLSVDCDT